MENHAAATALNYFAYNFIKIHRTLRTSPAMAAGVTDRLWSVENLVALWEAYEQRRAERAASMGTMKNHLLAVAIGASLGAATLGVMLHNILLWAAIGGAVGVAYERRNRISK